MRGRLPGAARRYLAALRVLAVATVALGLVYPLAVTGIAQAVAGDRANGSLLRRDGVVVGSRLLGQRFTDARGRPLPQWFQPRPSAAGYDGAASGATNLGPDNPVLVAAIRARRAQIAAFEGVSPAAVPPDAVTASGSGLDPHISPAYALLQVPRVARARHLDPATVRALVRAHIQGRGLGFLGEPTVNVLELNLALPPLPA
jgi:K+-transporting ATPase ATPase C chain